MTYKNADINKWVSMLMPEKIQFPEGFMLLGALTGLAIGIRHSEPEQRWAAQGIAKLSLRWSKYNPPPMSDHTSSTSYKDTLYNQFVSQVQTMAGLVHMHYGAVYGSITSTKHEQVDNEQSYYDKGPVYDE